MNMVRSGAVMTRFLVIPNTIECYGFTSPPLRKPLKGGQRKKVRPSPLPPCILEEG
jgi:hypothetical protein